MRKFRTDYHEARDAAQAMSNKLKMLVRLRGVTEFGRKGFIFNLVPRYNKQFGRDLEGELVQPDKWEDAEPLLCGVKGAV